MEEREAEYIVEFCEGLKRTALAAYRVGNPQIYWRPGDRPQSRECQVVYPVIGAKSCGSVLATLCGHLGNQREIEVCPRRRNVWLAKSHCGPSDKLKVGVTDADWAIRIWTEADPILPETNQIRAIDCTPHRPDTAEEANASEFESSWGSDDADEAYDIELVEDDESEEELIGNEIRRRATAMSEFIVGHRMSDKVFVMPLQFGPSTQKSFLLYTIHGLSSSFAGIQLARDLMKEFSFLNAVGIMELSDKDRERGWSGKYAIQLAELHRNM